ncbi:MAG: hypothetical protein IJR60_06180 [Eubacterium sp.]|nr:hypothetical protein [Eubacterium sp.]
MKKLRKCMKESGAIAVMTAVMLTVLLGFTALSIDIGLHHYLGAKLQNAADAAATAVGQKIESDEGSLDKCAYEYLAKNGYDYKGKYKDKITADVKIKGVVNGAFYESTSESDDYLDYTLVKVTVDVDDSTLFANALGISSLHLRKVSYVIVKPNYDGMPEALKYSIFAGAEMGDKDSSADENNVYIDAQNPAMDIQGSTGAGSGETALSSVVAVAENTINGVNDFVQNLKGWMNDTFGTSFSQDYNKLVNINLSEAIMNNDAHSNANILIGVQALNAARSKDNDYDGTSVEAAKTDPDYNYVQNTDDRYNGLTDADDYGMVHFSAVDTIDFGYSRYAQQRANAATQAAQANNIFDKAGNAINWALYNYLDNQPEQTRVYVQNQQKTQVVQHVINILNEIDLDSCTSSGSNALCSSALDDNLGKFEIAAKRYFKENNAVSETIQSKVLAQELNLTFDSTNKTLTLASQESIVYRVNQKVSAQYLDAYSSLEVEGNDAEEVRKGRFDMLVEELGSNHDQEYKTDQQSSSGFVFQGTADKDGGSIGDNQTENITLQRYEKDNQNVPKGTEGATLKYTYSLHVTGNKVNRNTDNVNNASYQGSSTEAERTRTNIGAKYAIVRTFKEKSDYIDMPNLAPFFTRQINKSIRSATKKRGQFTDGKTKGSRNVQVAVQQAKSDLEEITDEVEYTDSTYSDSTKYTNEYSRNLLFQDFKTNKSDGLTTLTTNEQTLGGVSMSNHSYKGFELYNSEGNLKTALEFVNEYDTHNKNNNWFGHNKVNYLATHQKFQNKDGTQEMNAVQTKKNEIKTEYADDGDENNKSYKEEKKRVNNEISLVDKYAIEDITGEGGAVSVSEKVLATPTSPLATINDTNGIFFKSTQSKLFGTANTFETELNSNQVTDAQLPTAVQDSEVALPSVSSMYSETSITAPTSASAFSYGGASSLSIPGAPSSPNVAKIKSDSELGNFSVSPWDINLTGKVGKHGEWYYELYNNCYFNYIDNPYDEHYIVFVKNRDYLSIIVPENGRSYVRGRIVINGRSTTAVTGGRSLNIKKGATLYTQGDITVDSGNNDTNINFGDSNGGANLYTDGNVYIGNNSNTTETLHTNSKVEVKGKFEVNDKLTMNSGVKFKTNNNLYSGSTFVSNGAEIRVGTKMESNGTASFNSSSNAKIVDYLTTNGKLTFDNSDVHVGDYVYANGDVEVNNASLVTISGEEKTTQSIDDTNYNLGLRTNGNITVQGGSTLKVNGDVGSTAGSKNVTVDTNSTMWVNGTLKVRQHLTVNSGAVLYVSGDIITYNDITNNGTIVCGGTVTTRSGSITNNGTINTFKMSSASKITNNGTLTASTVNGVAGNVSAGGDIEINSGSTTTVNGNLTSSKAIINDSTINCVGTVQTGDGDLTNKTGRTIRAGAVSVLGTSSQDRWVYNYGTIETVGNFYVNGQLRNNLAWNSVEANGTKYDIPTMVKVGGSLTTDDKVINNPGTSYTSGANNNPDAVIRVNGNMSVNGDIQNNYSNNPSGARAFIVVGGRLTGSTLKNLEKSFVYSNGEIAPSSIENSNNSQIRTAANINTGDITNSSGGYIYASTGIKGATIKNYAAQMYTGGNLEATGNFSSEGAVRASGNFIFAGTATTTNAIFTCGGAVQGTGSITCINLVARSGITANSLTFTGNVKTDGTVTLTGDLSIGSTSNFTVANGNLTAASITNNNSLIVNGNITATGTLTNMKDLFCFGNLIARGGLINGTTSYRNVCIKCKGTVTVGNNNDAYLENYGKMYVGRVTNSTNPSTVVLTVNGATINNVDGNDRRRSIRNFGDILTAGSVSAKSVLYSYGGNIYVYGNIITCNDGVSTQNGNNLLEVKGSTRIFVHGCVKSNDSGAKRIWMYNATGNDDDSSPNTVLSIFGNGKGNNDCFGNTLEAFCNKQQGSTIYLNSDLYLSGTGSADDSCLYNAGRLYVNGEIDCPNMKSAWLVGSYDYGRTLAQDYVEGTYENTTPKYSGLTYCKGCFDAPNAVINVGGKHFVFVEDALTENFDGHGTLNKNINVKQVVMWGESMFYAPNQADIADTIDVSGTAIFNVQNQVNASGTNIEDGSGGQVVAPVEVDIVEGQAANLTGLSNVVFNRDITTSSLRGTRVEIKIVGDLVVNGAITLTRSRLIVTGVIRCQSMTLNASKVNCGSTLTVANGSTGGALTMTNGSRMNVEGNLVNVGAISEDNSGMFVQGEISTADSITLTNGSGLITRNSVKDSNNHPVEGNHNNNINLGGATTLSGGSKLFVDGKLNTSAITVNGASTLYAYTGAYFTTTPANISIDLDDHRDNNSKVFLGEANTRDDIKYNLYINGTLYLPNKDYGKNSDKLTTVDIRNYGMVICNGNITTDWIQVGADSTASGKALLFVAGRTTLKNSCSYTSYGRLWAYGGTDLGAARTGGKNDPNFPLKDGGEIYMGEIYYNGTKTGTWNYGYYEGHGDVYIDGNLNVTNYSDNSDNKVGNRGTAMYIKSGMTYVSGNVTLCNDNAFRSMEGAGLVCQKDFKVGCTIWNFGKLHIYGGFTMDNSAEYITDNKDTKSKPYEGWSFRNGWEEGRTDASFIAYNYGNKGGLCTFKGYFKNAGSFQMNYGLSVEGYTSQTGMYGDYAFVGYAGSDTQFSGEFRCNGNRFFNKWNTSYGCDGRLTYSEIAFNCGQMYVGGDLINGGLDNNNYQDFSIRKGSDARDNGVGWLNINGSDSRSFAFMNGGYKVNGDTSSNNGEGHIFKNALLFVGGNLQLGDYESQKKAGTLLNEGTIYTRGNCKVYSYGGGETFDSGPAFYMTAIMATENSNTFIGGECYSGAALATGKNSIFICDGDLRAKRPLKVNMWFRYYHAGGTAGNVLSYFEDEQYKGKGWLGSNDDGYRACYMRVGGSVYANIEGRDLENSAVTNFLGDLVPYDHSRDIDIQSNANIIIGGGFYCPQKLYLKQNVKMILCGQGNGIYDNNGNLNWKARGLDELSDQKNNPLSYGPGVTDILVGNVKNLVNLLNGERCTLFAYMLLDMNICSKLVVNGNAFVRDTCKIRDMTKTYIYGDLIAKDYLEIGKSLSEGNADATEARLDQYKKTTENDTDYYFSNAGYMYVQGNMTSSKYTKIYASTTVRVGGNMEAQNISNGYITLRHDARLYVGGNMKAQTSIDGGAYSELYVGGNMTATLSNIKLRDQITCYVGKNMTSPTYIELGKYDENFYRGVKSQRIQKYLNEAGDAHDDDRIDETGTVTDGGEFGYNGDEHERKDNEVAPGAGNDNDTETENSATDDKIAVNDDAELENDDSDLAVGSEFYVGGNIISYTSYVREYAYTRTVSGGIVLALTHITLRHNSDLWVLPEVFGNTTYHTTEFEYPDGWNDTLWSTLTTTFQKIGHDLKEDFEPKPGSIYSLGQLNMNTNTSIFGTYDTMVFGQTVLRKSSLIFVGHDFDCWAPIYNVQTDFSSWDAFWDSMKGNIGLSENKTYKGFDSYDSTQNTSNPKPIVIYANNEINVATTARIRSTYFIANRGDVNFTNLNFASETSETTPNDAKLLPNAFASYKGDVNFYALRGALGALMYAPQGDIDLDGFAYDFYGSMVGDTIDINTFYINVHRFNNWRTMDLHIASAEQVYIVSEKKYKQFLEKYSSVDSSYIYGYEKNPDPSINEWAQPFFPGLKDDDEDDTSSETGTGEYDDGFTTP